MRQIRHRKSQQTPSQADLLFALFAAFARDYQPQRHAAGRRLATATLGAALTPVTAGGWGWMTTSHAAGRRLATDCKVTSLRPEKYALFVLLGVFYFTTTLAVLPAVRTR